VRRKKIEILPGGGINRFTVADVVSRTALQARSHGVAGGSDDCLTRPTSADPGISFGSAIRIPEDRFDATSTAAVAEVCRLLQGRRRRLIPIRLDGFSGTKQWLPG